MSHVARAALWLYTIFLGITLGAGLYEARIIVPIWQATSPDAWPNTGITFWAFVSTGPLTLLIIAGLFFAWRSEGPARRWWLSALGVSVVERATTFGYFIPTMVALQGKSESSESVAEGLATWAMLNNGRHLLSLAAFLLAIKALTHINATRSPLQ